jgi:hypothetical protein
MPDLGFKRERKVHAHRQPKAGFPSSVGKIGEMNVIVGVPGLGQTMTICMLFYVNIIWGGGLAHDCSRKYGTKGLLTRFILSFTYADTDCFDVYAGLIPQNRRSN